MFNPGSYYRVKGTQGRKVDLKTENRRPMACRLMPSVLAQNAEAQPCLAQKDRGACLKRALEDARLRVRRDQQND